MKCPECKSDQVSTIDSRPLDKNNAIRRRRICDTCGFRWSTQELPKALIDFYEEQLKRLYALEQFQLASSVYKGDNRKARGTAWTKSETDRLVVMYFEQLPLREIAESLNRSYMSINKRLSYLRKKGKLAI
jgi:transcriptional regulator NrdR family protein